MNSTLKKLLPYLLILLGLFLLLFIGLAIPAGVCLLLGIVLTIESIWPEKWEKEKQELS